MKLYFLCLSALTVGALCKIDDVCIVQSGKKEVSGKCQKKGECMKAGLAAFSKSGRFDVSGTVEELVCPGEDEEVQCCVEIKCGSHTCRNNVESNPCAEGVYVANFRDRALCPSSSSEDNVQCCVKNSHNGLKRRQDSDVYGGRSIRRSAFSYFTHTPGGIPASPDGFDMASAKGVLSTLNNDDVGTGITPIAQFTPFGGSPPDTNIALPGDAGTSAGTLSPLPATTNTDIALGGTTPSGTSNTASDLGGTTPAGISNTASDLGGTTPASTSNTALALGGTTPAGTPDTALALGGTTPAGTPDTALALGGTTSAGTPNTDIALDPDLPASSSNFNLAQVNDYSQSPNGMTRGGTVPDEGVSFGINHGLRPELTYNNGGGSSFSVGPTTSLPNMLSNPSSSFNGVQADFNIGFRKLKRSLADAFN